VAQGIVERLCSSYALNVCQYFLSVHSHNVSLISSSIPQVRIEHSIDRL